MIKREDGIATLELGLVVPLLVMMLTLVVPVLQLGAGWVQLHRATAAGVRYASRTDTNVRTSAHGLTRRPSAQEVETFVRDAAGPIDPDDVTTYVDGVERDPHQALPGEAIEVRAGWTVTFPLAGVVNTLSGRELLPDEARVEMSAHGREE